MRLSSLLVLRSFSSCRMPHLDLTSKFKANPEMAIEICDTMTVPKIWKTGDLRQMITPKTVKYIKMAPWKWLRAHLTSIKPPIWETILSGDTRWGQHDWTHQGDPLLMCSQKTNLGPRAHSRTARLDRPLNPAVPGKRQCKYFPKRQRLTGTYTLTQERWEMLMERSTVFWV